MEKQIVIVEKKAHGLAENKTLLLADISLSTPDTFNSGREYLLVKQDIGELCHDIISYQSQGYSFDLGMVEDCQPYIYNLIKNKFNSPSVKTVSSTHISLERRNAGVEKLAAFLEG